MIEPVEVDITEIPIYWINLDDAVERRECMESLFKNMGSKM